MAADHAPPHSQDRRTEWLDIARGIGIVLVVFGHVLPGLIAAKILGRTPWAVTTEYVIYVFHMPLFFFLSGLHVEKSLAKGRSRFLINKLWTVAYPYFLWSVVQGGVQVAMSRDLNTPVGVETLLRIPIQPIAQFWFLYALMACHLVVLVFGVARRWLLVACACAVLVYLSQARLDLIAKTAYHFLFYCAGIVLHERVMHARLSRAAYSAIAPVLVVAFGACAAVNGIVTDLAFYALEAIPAAACGTALVVVLSRILEGRRSQLDALGRMSMTIFVLHNLAGSGTRIVLMKMGIRDPALHLVLGTTVGLLAPVIAHLALDRLGLLPFLGLAAPRARPSTRLKVGSMASALPETSSTSPSGTR